MIIYTSPDEFFFPLVSGKEATMGTESDSIIECPNMSCGFFVSSCFYTWAMMALLSGIGVIAAAQWSIHAHVEDVTNAYCASLPAGKHLCA